jgi:hypothetical protein
VGPLSGDAVLVGSSAACGGFCEVDEEAVDRVPMAEEFAFAMRFAFSVFRELVVSRRFTSAPTNVPAQGIVFRALSWSPEERLEKVFFDSKVTDFSAEFCVGRKECFLLGDSHKSSLSSSRGGEFCCRAIRKTGELLLSCKLSLASCQATCC